MKTGEALQVYMRVHARAAAATGEQTGWLLTAATRQDDGTFQVSVTSDSHARRVPQGAGRRPAGHESGAPRRGSTAAAPTSCSAPSASGTGAVASAEASLYLVPAGDAGRPPPASANAIGTADLEVKTLAALSGDATALDDDCDGAPNMWDPEPAGATPPVLAGFPGSPVHVVVGGSAPFKIVSPEDGLTFKWTASDPSVTVASSMLGAMVTPSVPGLFHLTVTGTRGTGAAAVFELVGTSSPTRSRSPTRTRRRSSP